MQTLVIGYNNSRYFHFVFLDLRFPSYYVLGVVSQK